MPRKPASGLTISSSAHAEEARGGDRGKRVGDVMRAGTGSVNAACLDAEAARCRAKLDILAANVGTRR